MIHHDQDFQAISQKICYCIFYDILIYSILEEARLEHLGKVLKILLENQFYLKESNCSFAQDTIEYLGHIVLKHGVQPENGKVAAVQKWPLPSSIKWDILQKIYKGLCYYCRPFD